MGSHNDRLLDPDALADLRDCPLGELRERRDACVEAETGLSYLRRMIQGSLDIVNRELARRAGGGDPLEVADLVEALPEILGEVPRPPGVGRLTQTLEPTDLDPELKAEFDAIVNDARIGQVADLGAADLTELLDQLNAVEEQVSSRRRLFQQRIDEFQAELARRYKTGEANVDELLK